MYTSDGELLHWLVQDLHRKLLKNTERFHQSHCSSKPSEHKGVFVAAHLLLGSSILSLDFVWEATQSAVVSFERWLLKSDFIHFTIENNLQDNIPLCFL